ncbi:hypothetical protein GCM10025779_09920 [Arthrobacter cryoconiti]
MTRGTITNCAIRKSAVKIDAESRAFRLLDGAWGVASLIVAPFLEIVFGISKGFL